VKIGDLIRDRFDDDIYLVVGYRTNHWMLLNYNSEIECVYDLPMNRRNYEVINEAR